MKDKLLGVTGWTAQLACVWLFSGAGGLCAHCAALRGDVPTGVTQLPEAPPYLIPMIVSVKQGFGKGNVFYCTH